MKAPDTLNIKEWAIKHAEELRESIRFHIANGIDKKEAVDMVLADTAIGSVWKGQIRYEFR